MCGVAASYISCNNSLDMLFCYWVNVYTSRLKRQKSKPICSLGVIR
jgi:hypothetical protein